MKNIWKLVSIVELIIYVLLSILIFTRSVDGAGVPQTPEIKLITWYILDIPFVFLLVIQIIWYFIIKKSKK